MLSKYLQAAMEEAHYEILDDDCSFVGTIPGFQGVYANAPTLEACRNELAEVLEEWIFLRISRGLPIPEANGLRLAIKEMA